MTDDAPLSKRAERLGAQAGELALALRRAAAVLGEAIAIAEALRVGLGPAEEQR